MAIDRRVQGRRVTDQACATLDPRPRQDAENQYLAMLREFAVMAQQCDDDGVIQTGEGLQNLHLKQG